MNKITQLVNVRPGVSITMGHALLGMAASAAYWQQWMSTLHTLIIHS
jgi:hypothetical protein